MSVIDLEIRGTVTASVPEESKGAAERGRGLGKFPRSARLLRHVDFERVYKLGRRHFSTSMTVFYLPWGQGGGTKPPDAPGVRIGFTVGRVLGGAVERNRIKRRMREAVRSVFPRTDVGADVVINPKKAVLAADFSVLVAEVRRAFEVIEQKLGRQSTR